MVREEAMRGENERLRNELETTLQRLESERRDYLGRITELERVNSEMKVEVTRKVTTEVTISEEHQSEVRN